MREKVSRLHSIMEDVWESERTFTEICQSPETKPHVTQRRNIQKLCLSRGRTKIPRALGARNLGVLGLDERAKAQVVMSSIILLKGKETETHASCR